MAYALWAIWPVFSLLWMLMMWQNSVVRRTLAGKPYNMKGWRRHETALFVPCRVYG